MKNNPFQNQFQCIPDNVEWSTPLSIPENINFSPKAYNLMITEQIAMPPARVWDKIEKILDEQDKRRKRANDIISTSLAPYKKVVKRKNFYLAAVSVASLLAGMIWKSS